MIRTSSSFFYPGAVGVKTGTTSLAGACLVAAANSRSGGVIAVVLGARNNNGVDRYGDAKIALDYGLQALLFDNASFVGQNVPSSINLGEQANATITMRNTGNTSWSAGYRLVSLASGWLTNSVAIGRRVAPGSSVTVTIPLLAAYAGDFRFQWRMYRPFKGRFGAATASRVIQVKADCATLNQQLRQAKLERSINQQELQEAGNGKLKAFYVSEVRRLNGVITAIEAQIRRSGC